MIDWESSRSSFQSASRDDDWPAMATLRARERTADLEGVREGPRHIRAVPIVTWRYKYRQKSVRSACPASSWNLLPAFCTSREKAAPRIANCPSDEQELPVARIERASHEGSARRGWSPRETTDIYEPLPSSPNSRPICQDRDRLLRTVPPLRILFKYVDLISMIKLLQSTVCSLRILANIPWHFRVINK